MDKDGKRYLKYSVNLKDAQEIDINKINMYVYKILKLFLRRILDTNSSIVIITQIALIAYQ